MELSPQVKENLILKVLHQANNIEDADNEWRLQQAAKNIGVKCYCSTHSKYLLFKNSSFGIRICFDGENWVKGWVDACDREVVLAYHKTLGRN